MTRPKTIHAIATKGSIESVYILAEQHGEAVIRLRDRESCLRFRNAMYKYRSKIRKTSAEVFGINSSHLDKFNFSFQPEHDFDGQPTGKWIFTVAYDDFFEFEILLPETLTEQELDALPHFDLNPPQAEDENEPHWP